MRRIILFFLLILAILPVLLTIFGWLQGGQEQGPMIRVYIDQEKKLAVMGMEDYLVGVVAAEMPAGFEEEALKAQAIAARTFALKRVRYYQSSLPGEHPKAPLCTRPEHCQGWLSREEREAKWGLLNGWRYEAKIRSAVQDTAGLVITYDQQLIDPVYHSTCGGRTAGAGEIWQQDVPYLKSVSCSWDRSSPKFSAQKLVSFKELKKELGIDLDGKPVSGLSPDPVLKVVKTTDSGRAKFIQAGDNIISGTEFRRRLGLNSTNLSWQAAEGGLLFSTIGYGHGVGMCQYGANGMAKSGRKAVEILSYYYQGVKIVKAY